jgi:parallel beta-helix repeat protein
VIQGTRAYVLRGNAGANRSESLQVLDITDATQPQLLGSFDVQVDRLTGLGVLHDVAYVGAFVDGLLVFDLSDPTTPRLVQTIGGSDPTSNIEVAVVAGPVVAGNSAYLVESQRASDADVQTEFLVVYDLRNTLAPVRRGMLRLRRIDHDPVLAGFQGGLRLAAASGVVYVALQTSGLLAVDVSDPNMPRLLGEIPTTSLTSNVTATDNLVYVSDRFFGLQVIQGSGTDLIDTDGDGVVDGLDRFPTDPTEFADTDNDRIGNNTDLDNDNDRFTDAEETAATPPTDPLDPRRYPVTAPPPGTNTLMVDAASLTPVRNRNGTPETPYRSPTEAITVIRNGQAPQVNTVHIRPGLYAPSTTQDIYPLPLRHLSGVTLQGAERDTTVLDAELRPAVVRILEGDDLTIEELTITHGGLGIFATTSQRLTINRNKITRNEDRAILVDIGSKEAVIHDNLIEHNGHAGIQLVADTEATVTHNMSRANNQGILVSFGSTAVVRDNVFEQNEFSGISVFANASATLINNIVQDNDLFGIATAVSTTSEIRDNTVERNGTQGIMINAESTAELHDNIVAHNGQDGILISSISSATINGGVITQNGSDGIRVGGEEGFLALPGQSTATIGLDSPTVIEISQNGDSGILVEDDGFDSEATIDSRNIQFIDNAGSDTVGNVINIAP